MRFLSRDRASGWPLHPAYLRGRKWTMQNRRQASFQPFRRDGLEAGAIVGSQACTSAAPNALKPANRALCPPLIHLVVAGEVGGTGGSRSRRASSPSTWQRTLTNYAQSTGCRTTNHLIVSAVLTPGMVATRPELQRAGFNDARSGLTASASLAKHRPPRRCHALAASRHDAGKHAVPPDESMKQRRRYVQQDYDEEQIGEPRVRVP
jgi:hypothetical protein